MQDGQEALHRALGQPMHLVHLHEVADERRAAALRQQRPVVDGAPSLDGLSPPSLDPGDNLLRSDLPPGGGGRVSMSMVTCVLPQACRG